MELSVVIPMYNEVDNVAPMMSAVRDALSGKIEYELIVVDDGSSDGTAEAIKRCLQGTERLVEFNRNYGQSAAMAAGIDQASGRLVATLDGDLQNHPSDILSMINFMQKEQSDVVAGWRKDRQDDMVLRKLPSLCANFLIRYMTGVTLKDYGCSLKVFKRDVAKNLGLYGELHRFIPVLARLYGAKICQMPVQHSARAHGISKYGIGRTIRVISDLMLMVFFQKYATRPMHLFGTIGFVLLIVGLGLGGYFLLVKLLGYSIAGRPLFIVAVMAFLSGIQLITTGFLSEILMRTYYESQDKKPYHIRTIAIANTREKSVS